MNAITTNNRFLTKEKHYLFDDQYGLLEVPYPGIEAEQHSSHFDATSYTLLITYMAVVEGKTAAVTVEYICPVAEFLKKAGVLDPKETTADDGLWELSEHEHHY